MVLGDLDLTTGVGGLTPGLDVAGLSFVRFGTQDPSTGNVNQTTMYDRGQGKIRIVLSSDGRQAQGSTPESYPSYIAGEVEINGFKINADDGDHNTVVGVFIGDKQEQ